MYEVWTLCPVTTINLGLIVSPAAPLSVIYKLEKIFYFWIVRHRATESYNLRKVITCSGQKCPHCVSM